MVSLYFSKDEKTLFERVNREGFEQANGYYWWPVRLALAQSLKLDSEPDERFRAPPTRDRGSELHLEQVTGRGQRAGQQSLELGLLGRDPDYDDALRLMLSVKHNRDLFANERDYVDLLQRHCRRGLEIIQGSWPPGRSLPDYLLDELFFGVGEYSPAGDDRSPAFDWPMLARGLGQIDVSAELAGEPVDGPRLSRYPLVLAAVDDYDRLRRGLDDLAFAIGLASGGLSLGREAGERRVVLDVPRPSATWRSVGWAALRAALADRDGALPVSPGVDLVGRPFVFDLAEAPHLFVAGATGSGKSVCLNAIILSLLAAREAPELIIIDPKGVDFADYEGCSRLRDRKVIVDMAEAVSVLRNLVDEMEGRQARLRELGVRNIADARRDGADLRRIVVIVDELADFLMGKSGAEEPLVRLAQKARASGIHLVLATQRPDAATFPGLLRANIPSRIALTVQKATDSRIILDETGAENLLMRGDMLVKLAGRDPMRVHGAAVSSHDMTSAISTVNSQ
jgi:S-DNA-T family DNA segregation ATPase FtsK/SpoIIIE